MAANIEELNDRYVLVLLPNIIWMFICLVCGLFGNGLVLLVYRFRMRSQRRERYFIPVLAAMDLIATIISTLQSILEYLYYRNFPSELLCKILVFGSFYVTSMSANMLLVISFQRYLKVCRPLKKQMTLFWKRFATILTIVLPFGYSLPSLMSSGNKVGNETLNDELGNLTATYHFCTLIPDDRVLFAKVYTAGIGAFCLIIILAMSVLYVRIGITIRHQILIKRRATYNKQIVVNVNSPTEENSEQHKNVSQEPPQEDTKSSNPDSESMHRSSTESETDNKVYSPEKEPYCNIGQNKINDTRKRKGNKTLKWKKVRVNFNLMFCFVVVFYFLSYLPSVVIYCILSFDSTLFHTNTVVVEFFSRFFILNHIINPLIYGRFDFQFRNAVKSFLYCRSNNCFGKDIKK